MDRPVEIQAAPPGRSFLVWGWVLAGLSAILPVFALGGLVFGAVAVTKNKPGHGAGMIVLSLLGSTVFFVYLASQTLVPR
ncbi:MAG: hypothetical protein QOJ43_265 [Gaiellaceae bacterium]|jgi:hypothetical protein|nr:hypothetical protein [Gaiellaceae bacterium]